MWLTITAKHLKNANMLKWEQRVRWMGTNERLWGASSLQRHWNRLVGVYLPLLSDAVTDSTLCEGQNVPRGEILIRLDLLYLLISFLTYSNGSDLCKGGKGRGGWEMGVFCFFVFFRNREKQWYKILIWGQLQIRGDLWSFPILCAFR